MIKSHNRMLFCALPAAAAVMVLGACSTVDDYRYSAVPVDSTYAPVTTTVPAYSYSNAPAYYYYYSEAPIYRYPAATVYSYPQVPAYTYNYRWSTPAYGVNTPPSEPGSVANAEPNSGCPNPGQGGDVKCQSPDPSGFR